MVKTCKMCDKRVPQACRRVTWDRENEKVCLCSDKCAEKWMKEEFEKHLTHYAKKVKRKKK